MEEIKEEREKGSREG